MKLFEIKNGDLFFGKFHALKNINLKIDKGEKVAILGHNGAGKSILVDILSGAKTLTNGKIEYGVKNIKEFIGIQFQNKDFPNGVKFRSLLEFYLDIYGMKLKDKRVDHLLASFQIKELLNRPLQKLSGGQKQKVNIVIALLNNPEILFVDEILTGLDITSQTSVLNLLVNYVKNNKELTVISVSHNEIEVNNLVDRIIVLKKGKVIKDIKRVDLIKKYKSVTNFMSTFGGEDV